MQRVFRVVDTRELQPVGPKTTNQFNRSIRRNGIVNPVVLAEVVDADGVIELAIIDGNRRIKAAQIARLPKIPAVVLKATTEKDRARFTLMCNYMRSANFHTESAAILTLAANEDAAAGAARAIGLGPAKMQQLYRKIATMPEQVRRAMYEHRIPVTAATWVGAWPEGLQQEMFELLGRRRYVNTTMMKDLREWYAERHPEEFGIVEQPKEHVPFDEWSSTDLHIVNIPAPPDVVEDEPERGNDGVALTDAGQDPIIAATQQPQSEPPIASAVPVPVGSGPSRVPAGFDGSVSMRPHDVRSTAVISQSYPDDSVLPERPSSPESTELTPPALEIANGSQAALTPQVHVDRSWSVTLPAEKAAATVAFAGRVADREPAALADDAVPSPKLPDDCAEQRVAFVLRLDATLRDLAGQGHALGISRSVWVDRTMRAWDRFEG